MDDSAPSSTPGESLLRCIVIIVVTVTGFCGLVYEVTWQRYLANLIGSQARAVSIILAVFLGGLCVGYTLFGVLSRDRTRNTVVRLCGWIEILIGVWGLCFPAIYSKVWQSIGILNPGSQNALLYDIGLCIVLIAVPTIGMGSTLPLLTQGLARDLDDASPFHAQVYAFNTGGAFIGCLVSGFILLPIFGLPRTMVSMGLINIICGLILLAIAGRVAGTTSAAATPKEQQQPPVESLSLTRASSVAFLAGFLALSLQTVFIRAVALSVGASEYSFAMVVSVFILMLALGAGLLTTGRQIRLTLWHNHLVIVLGLVVLFYLIPFWPYASHVIRTLFDSSAGSFVPYYASLLLLFGVILAVPVGMMGCTMPLLFRSVEKSSGRLGSAVGKLYGWNTLGCVVGALTGGHWLLYFWNLDKIYLAAVLVAAAALIIVGTAPSDQRGRSVIAALVTISLIVFAAIGHWNPTYFAIGTFRLRTAQPYSYEGPARFYKGSDKLQEIMAYIDGPNTSVAVIDKARKAIEISRPDQPISRALYVNGKSDGSTAGPDFRTTSLLAHLPALLMRSTSGPAAVVGFGTGISVGALGLHPHITDIDCIEISSAVREVAPMFAQYNYNADTLPRFRWQVGDAYRVLGSSEKRYATIISEPSNPWVAGVEKLFAVDFYRIVRDRLLPDGVYAQWLHLYSLSDETFSMVLGGFRQVFPHLRVFRVGYDVIVLGSFRPIDAQSIELLSQRRSHPAVAEDLRQLGLERAEALLALELWLPPEGLSQGPTHSLEFPRLAYQAGRDFFVGESVDLAALTDNAPSAAVVRSSKSSLFNLWQTRFGTDLNGVIQYAQFACHMSELKVSQEWRETPASCRAALLALVANGVIPPELGLSDREQRLLSYLRSGEQDPPEAITKNIEVAEQALLLYRDANSILMNLEPTSLLDLTEPCFRSKDDRARQCRNRLVELLLTFGHTDLAQAVREESESAVSPTKPS